MLEFVKMFSPMTIGAPAPSPVEANADELSCKVLIIGASAAGKTRIMRKIVYGQFVDKYTATIGVDFGVFSFDNVRLQLWDTAGQERFGPMMRAYYKSAAGIVLVYDVTKSASINIEELKMCLQNAIESCSPVPILLLGNKSDGDGAIQLQDLSELQTILDSHPGFEIVGHELVSAKDDSQEQLQAVLGPLVQVMKAKPVAGPADDARIQLDAEAAAPSTPSKGCRC